MFKSLVYSLITKISVALINFAILLVSSRYLGVNSRGEISIFILNITIIQIVNEVYTGYSIVHFIPKYNFKRLVTVGLMYTFIFCSFSNLIVIFLNKQLLGYEWIAYSISLLVIINTFNCVLILGKENLKTYNLLSFIQPFILLAGIFIFIFIFKIYTVAAFVYPLLISFSLVFIISAWVVSGYLFSSSTLSDFKIKPILLSGLLYQAGSLMYIFSNRYSYYILPDTASVGLYSSASSLMESVLIVVNGISPVLLSRIANRTKSPDNAELTLSLAKASLIVSTCIVGIIFLIPSEYFVLVLGNGFLGIKELMLLYAPSVMMASFFISLSNYFVALGNQKVLVFCYGLGFLSSIFLAPLLIHKFSTTGAALNANLSYLLMCVSMTAVFFSVNKLKLNRLFSFREDYKNIKELIYSLH